MVKKSWYIRILCMVMASGFWCTASAFTLSPQMQQNTQDIVDDIITNHYDKALGTIAGFSEQTTDPLFDVLALATIGLRDVDFEKTIDSIQFLTTYDKTIASIRRWETMHGVSSYTQMFSGMSMLIHASFYLRQKKYFASMQNVFEALRLLEDAQDADSTNYEIDLFLGLYEYARAELRSRLWWILFWYPGNREHGIERVLRSARKGNIIDEAAKLSLCDIFVQEKKLKDARRYLDELVKRYPSSRFVLWAEVKYFEAEQEFENAARVYSRLSSSYRMAPEGDYNFLFTGFKEAEMLYKSDKKKEAYTICDNLLKNKQLINYRSLKRDLRKLMERCK